MADLLLQERLQPSLLDRLTDDDPDTRQEPRNKRVIPVSRLRELVLRDLAWLLNTGCMGQRQDLALYPQVAKSVLNYGMPDLAGRIIRGAELIEIQNTIKKAILAFEPRILETTLNVKILASGEAMVNRGLIFEIEGELWSQPIPLQLFMKTEFDLETGESKVIEVTR